MSRLVREKIPDIYLQDFERKQVMFTKGRVKLLCSLTVAVFFALSLLDFVFTRSEHIIFEVSAGLFLVMAGFFSLFLSSRAKTLRGTKYAVIVFVAFLVLTILRLGTEYYQGPVISASIYVFSMFIIAMTIPLTPGGLIPIAFLHAAGFMAENVYVGFSRGAIQYGQVAGGCVYILIAFGLCSVIRRKEVDRDVDNFILLKKVEEKNTQMERDLELATKVHMTIIPEGIETDLVDIKVTYLPAYYVGGDYARYIFLHGDKVTFIISDVTGHGVTAALLVNRMHTEFERLAREGRSPGELMRELDVFIKEDFEGSGMYLTAFCGQLDMRKMKLKYSGYAHPAQYLYKPGEGILKEMVSDGGMLGIPVGSDDVFQEELEVDDGDRIMLYTDGITETFNSNGEEYGNEKLKDFFLKNNSLSPADFQKGLLEELDSFRTVDFRDDICMMNMEVRSHGSFRGWLKHM